ncbi:MAG: DNA/RNA non-specific endonuclease [Pirellulaceae bacterium]|nr:DNA/RNA non-specific endonuclease [Pirellulaceae bacterium]
MRNRKPVFDDYFAELMAADTAVKEEMVTALEVRKRTLVVESLGSTGNSASEFVRETVVLTKGRPVLDIKAGAAVIEITEVESQIWRKRLTEAAPLLAPHIPAVGRIEVANHPRGVDWLGTAWLLRDNIIVTNRHVADAFAHANGSEFTFRMGFDGQPMQGTVDFIEEFDAQHSAEFPFKVVHIERDDGPDLAFLRIEPVAGQELPNPVILSSTAAQGGDQVAVIGYPARDPYFPDPDLMDRIFNHRYDKKRLAPGLITGSDRDRIFHDCSTLGGNSGGEVVSLKTGQAVALHFAGTLFTKNHAIPIHTVAQRLDDVLRRSSHPVTSVSPNKTDPTMLNNNTNTHANTNTNTNANANINVNTGGSGSRVVEVTIPLHIRVELGEAQLSAAVAGVASGVVPTIPPAQPVTVDLSADDDFFETSEARVEDYRDRKGYQSKFLGSGIDIPLPTLTDNQDDTLTYMFEGKQQALLPYMHFSVLMSKSRRMCRFSACNIDGKKSLRTSRSGWQYDPRIPKTAQIMKECYGNPPKFSRGHMTRREDPAWGTKSEADLGNRDSMHVTNTTPQVQMFNGGIWLSLEDYALQNAREDGMRICVFTGPFLAKNDPFRFKIKIPVTFWKVIAFIHDETGQLCATGYTMSQKSFIGEEEFVFGRFEHAQRPIREIERRAGISFGQLAEVDPLNNQPESATPIPLTQLSQIRFV